MQAKDLSQSMLNQIWGGFAGFRGLLFQAGTSLFLLSSSVPAQTSPGWKARVLCIFFPEFTGKCVQEFSLKISPSSHVTTLHTPTQHRPKPKHATLQMRLNLFKWDPVKTRPLAKCLISLRHLSGVLGAEIWRKQNCSFKHKNVLNGLPLNECKLH